MTSEFTHLLRLPRRRFSAVMHALALVEQKGRDHAMAHHTSHLPIPHSLGLAEAFEAAVRRHAAVGVRDHYDVFAAFDELRDGGADQGFVGVHGLDCGVAPDGWEVQADTLVAIHSEDAHYLFEAGGGVPGSGDKDDAWFGHNGGG